MKHTNFIKKTVFVIPFVIFLFMYLFYIKESVVTKYKITKLRGDIKVNSSAIFLPNENKIKVFYNFKEKKINKLPYKDNIVFEKAIIPLDKKKIESGVYNLEFQLKDTKYNSLLISNPKFEDKGDILVIVPDLTLQAYSTSIGLSFYERPKEWIDENQQFFNKIDKNWKKNTKEIWLNMYRPEMMPTYSTRFIKYYNGIADLQSYYNSKNIKFDFISQKFLHTNSNRFDLNKYKLIILFGHDEYWTYEIQKIIFRSVRNGLNILNLSGNTYWWTLKEDNDYINRYIYGYNHSNQKLVNHEILLGTSFRFGGYPLLRKHNLKEIKKSSEFRFLSEKKIYEKINGLEIIKPKDNIFKGTGLKYGDIIGFQRKINKIEMDGVSEIKIISDLVKDNLKQKANSYKLKVSNQEYLATTYASRLFPKKIGVIGRNNYFKGKIISTGMIGWAENIKDKTIKRITINMIEELLD